MDDGFNTASPLLDITDGDRTQFLPHVGRQAQGSSASGGKNNKAHRPVACVALCACGGRQRAAGGVEGTMEEMRWVSDRRTGRRDGETVDGWRGWVRVSIEGSGRRATRRRAASAVGKSAEATLRQPIAPTRLARPCNPGADFDMARPRCCCYGNLTAQ